MIVSRARAPYCLGPARAAGLLRRASAASLILLLAGCSKSPSQDLLGSFFPSWLLCAAVGIVAAVLAHLLLRLSGLADALWLPIMSYPAMALAVAFAIWLVWFGH